MILKHQNGITEEVLASKQLSNRKTALEEFVKDKNSCDLLIAHNKKQNNQAAVMQQGRKIVVNAEMAMDLFRKKSEKMLYSQQNNNYCNP